MQRRVTGKFSKNKRMVLSIFIFLIIFVIVLFVTISILVDTNKLTCFDEFTSYFVYTNKYSTKSSAESHSSELASLGGAGLVYEKNGVYYLIASAYSEKSDAEEVLAGVKQNFSEAGILSLKTPKIEKSVKISLKQNTSSLIFFKFFEKLIESVEELSMKYIAGTVTVNGFLGSLLDEKLELDTLIKKFSGEEEPFSTVLTHMNLCKLYLDKFFSKFFETTKKDSTACLLSVELMLLRYEFWGSM